MTQRYGTWLADSPRPIPGVPLDVHHLFVVGTASIFEVTRDGVALADRDRKVVAFEFNRQVVVLRPGDDPDSAARSWWATAYGETPEQTWARR